MGSLFFNKVAAALLGAGLVILGLVTLADTLFHPEQPEQYGYPVDLAALEGHGGGEEEVEGPTDFGLLLASADVSAGERIARRCASCHTFDEGGADGTGPHLWDVMGRAVASVGGFGYSGAMTEYAGTVEGWGVENMYNFLESPRRYMPGTAMSFAGLRNQEDRINLIAYMRGQSNDPIALPAPLAAAAADVEAHAEDAMGQVEDAMGDITEAANELAEDAGEMMDDAMDAVEGDTAEDHGGDDHTDGEEH